MKIMILALISLSILNANEVYDISQKDYELYKKDNQKMIEVFKHKFLEKDNSNVIVDDKQKALQTKYDLLLAKNKKLETAMDNSKKTMAKKPIVKVIKTYEEKELLSKLNIIDVKESKNLTTYFASIDKVLLSKKIKYEKNEIKNILELINKKELSSFESKLYLEQIKELIKG